MTLTKSITIQLLINVRSNCTNVTNDALEFHIMQSTLHYPFFKYYSSLRGCVFFMLPNPKINFWIINEWKVISSFSSFYSFIISRIYRMKARKKYTKLYQNAILYIAITLSVNIQIFKLYLTCNIPYSKFMLSVIIQALYKIPKHFFFTNSEPVTYHKLVLKFHYWYPVDRNHHL